MEKILFEENPTTEPTYRKWSMFGAIMCFVASAILIAFGVVIGYELRKAPLWWIAIDSIFFLFALIPIYSGISVLYSRRQFIRIYSDRIVYRHRFQKTEQVICLPPHEYKIKLHLAMDFLGSYPQKSVIQFIFLDDNGKKLLSYKAPTFHRSPYQSPRHKWEDDLLSLGCEIIDYEKIIVNK